VAAKNRRAESIKRLLLQTHPHPTLAPRSRFTWLTGEPTTHPADGGSDPGSPDQARPGQPGPSSRAQDFFQVTYPTCFFWPSQPAKNWPIGPFSFFFSTYPQVDSIRFGPSNPDRPAHCSRSSGPFLVFCLVFGLGSAWPGLGWVWARHGMGFWGPGLTWPDLTWPIRPVTACRRFLRSSR